MRKEKLNSKDAPRKGIERRKAKGEPVKHSHSQGAGWPWVIVPGGPVFTEGWEGG